MLTAHKSGTPPVTSVLLSTDMFTLIDEDAIVPFDGLIKTDDDKKWMGSFFPAFMENSKTGGKIWGAPFQRSRPEAGAAAIPGHLVHHPAAGVGGPLRVTRSSATAVVPRAVRGSVASSCFQVP